MRAAKHLRPVGLLALAIAFGCGQAQTTKEGGRSESPAPKNSTPVASVSPTTKAAKPPVDTPVAKSDTPGPTFHALGLPAALEKAKADKKLVMVDFYADWCGPCRALDKNTWTDKNVKEWLREKTVAIKINVDDAAELSQKYKITGIPALVFFKPDGKEAGRIVGYHDADGFLEKAGDIVAKQ
jgi:thiol:disulfide interchange protein